MGKRGCSLLVGVVIGAIVGLTIGGVIAFACCLVIFDNGLDYIAWGLAIGAVSGGIIGTLIGYASDPQVKEEHRKKISLFFSIALTIALTIWLIWYLTSIPEIQDFPGLPQELDHIEESTEYYIEFVGEYGNRIKIEARGPWRELGNRAATCKLLNDTVRSYIGNRHQLSVELIKMNCDLAAGCTADVFDCPK